MIVDTSAILAILLDEPERKDFARLIDRAAGSRLSAGSRVELASVSTLRFGGGLHRSIDRFLDEFDVTIVPVSVEQCRLGSAAYARYGIGTGHPARLNLGDCFAYALAKATEQPLLFKRAGFTHTDVRRAIG